MTKDEALDLALDALESCMYPQQKQFRAITAIKQARALDKKAENARELGLDYEPVWCGHCNGSGRMVRDPDIGTDQECFVCDGAGVPAAPVQEPYKSMSEHIAQATSGRVCIDSITGDVGIGTPAAQSAPVQEPVATISITRRGSTRTIDNHFSHCVRDWPDGEYKLVLATPPAAQRQPLTDEQIKQIYTEQTGSFIDDSPWALLDFARAIEAAHGITGETKWTNNN